MKSYFPAGAEDRFVFLKKEMENKIDLHAIRATVAKRAYRYYSDKLRSDSDYRAQLTKEIELRWKMYRGTPPPNSRKKYDWEWDERRVCGEYQSTRQKPNQSREKRSPRCVRPTGCYGGIRFPFESLALRRDG